MTLNHMTRACLANLVLAAVGVAIAAAQPANSTPAAPAAPTTPAAPVSPAAPATAPQAPIPDDQSTPRGALKMLMVAMNKGDFDAVKAVFAPNGAVETKMVDALIDQQRVMLKFRNSVIKQFGADEAKAVVGDIDADQAKALDQLSASTEQIDGQDAVIIDGEGQKISLKKQGDKWAISVLTLFPQIPPDKLDALIAQVAQQKALFDDTADEITAGKYKTAADARQALQAKAFEMQAKAQADASSQPAGGPTTEPATQP